MKRHLLPETDLLLGRVGFGTASLHHVGALPAQAAHLDAVAELGITHFDTAPLYGFGGAERALGQAFGGSNDITVATKVGLYPPGGARQGYCAALLRKTAGKAVPALSRAVADLSVTRARESLTSSLQRLGRDCVDLLFLHEPDAALVRTDEWQRFLEEDGDRFNAFGVAGPSGVVAPFVQVNSPLAAVVQTRDSLVTREADFLVSAGRPLQLTYGYFASDRGEMSSDEILEGALARVSGGTILVSSRSLERLSHIARIAAHVRQETSEGQSDA